MRRSLFQCTLLACTLSILSPAEVPRSAPPAPSEKSFQAMVELGNMSEPRRWIPMKGTAPVSVIEVSGRPLLRMRCNFRGTQIERASWDRALKLDLADAEGIQFHVACRDPSPVSHFSLYLRSGEGWYSSSFSPEPGRAWSLIKIRKEDTRIEGTPSGWSRIDGLRISAWRGKDKDTELFLCNLVVRNVDAKLAVIRGESVYGRFPAERQSVVLYARNVGAVMETLRLPYVVLSDLDVLAGKLAGKKIAVLPHNPGMPDAVSERLVQFMEAGGKVLAFYLLPSKLRSYAGIKGGRHVRQERPGQFASIRVSRGVLQGAPAETRQHTWNIQESNAVSGRSRVLGTWYDDAGRSTGYAAIVAGRNCVYMNHVLLMDDQDRKCRVVLAMLGYLAPGFWDVSAGEQVERIGRLGQFAGFQEVENALKESPGWGRAAEKHMVRAASLREQARVFYEGRSYPEAIIAAGKANKELTLAWCAVQESRGNEFRAFWCHSAFGVPGMDWDEAIRGLAQNGFTAIFPNMLWGGTAYYRSNVLPVNPAVAKSGDQLAACVAACRRYRVECHVWKVNWNMSRLAPAGFVEKMREQGRIQVSFKGEPLPIWLCPSHPANQRLEIEAMVEVVAKYPVQGIHFDYIRYPGQDYCFCDGCRERFEKAKSVKVKDWPAHVRGDPGLHRKWLDFRRENITAVVRAVSEAARKLRPGIKISAAVFRNWAVDRDKVGQDWKPWCEKGYLDFVCPMDYTRSAEQLERWVNLQKGWAGRTPCYPGIGLSVWGGPDPIWRLIEQITITRRLGMPGFILFNYAEKEARKILPLCGMGITRPN